MSYDLLIICSLFYLENGCVVLPGEGSEGLLLPSFQHDPVLPIEDSAGRGGSNFSSTILAQSTLIPGPNGDDGGNTQAFLSPRKD